MQSRTPLRLPNASVWQRFLEYASLVREITYLSGTSVGELRVLQAVSTSFLRSFPRRVLLPNLQVLGLHLRSPSTIPFLSPSLHRIGLCITLDTSPEVQNLALEAIQNMPNLSAFYLDSDVDIVKRLCKIRNAKNIQEVTIGEPIDMEELTLLQSFSDLRVLSICTDIDPQSGLAPLSFPNLEKLEINGFAYTTALLVHDMQLRPQREICVVLEATMDDSYPSLISVLGCLQTSTLQTIRINVEYQYDAFMKYSWGVDTSIRLEKLLQPIVHFRNLKRLILDLRIPLEVFPDDIKALAVAFPSILEMELGPATWVPSSYETPVSPSCLLEFAQQLPQLLMLAIYLNGRWEDLIEICASFSSNSQLQHLNVGGSILNHGANACDYTSRDVAKALITVFPKLKHLHFAYECSAETDNWERSTADAADRAIAGAWMAVREVLSEVHTGCMVQNG
ncbi:hypothetical protein FRC03_001007 [Tulasnella sp. 419]|nr:hypothetical protein FRC03_001007 [Tulasnella sp. 419]